MKTQTAPHKEALKKRVDRFFNYSTSFRSEVSQFVNNLANQDKSNIYAFGGLVRDIGLFGVREFQSDVDLVFDGHKRELERALLSQKDIHINENKFGGFRIKLKNWDVDIWCAEDTWAIKRGLVDYEDINSLLNTTLMSWDAVLFDIKNQSLICNNGYLDNLSEGRLDVILTETPNELGSMVRLARAIYSKGARTLSNETVDLINTYFMKFSHQEIIEYEKSSYSKRFISENKLNQLHERVSNSQSENDLFLDFSIQLCFEFKE